MRAAAWGWTAVVFIVLWMPTPPPPERGWWWWDELVHFGLLAPLSALWVGHGLRDRWALVLGVGVGAITELGQGWLPWERHPSVHDFGVDMLGVVAGIVVARWVRSSW